MPGLVCWLVHWNVHGKVWVRALTVVHVLGKGILLSQRFSLSLALQVRKWVLVNIKGILRKIGGRGGGVELYIMMIINQYPTQVISKANC